MAARFRRLLVKDGDRYRVLHVLPRMTTFTAQFEFLSTTRIASAPSYSQQELRDLLAQKGLKDLDIGLVLAGLEGVDQLDRRTDEQMDNE